MTSTQCSENYSVSINNDKQPRDQIDSWVMDYIFDYATSLSKKEMKRPSFRGWSPQLPRRGEVVEFIKALSEQFGFSHVTRHLGMYMIDQFMDDRHLIREPYIKLFAVACLILAAKHEESEMQIPKLSVLQEYVDVDFNRQDFIILECTIMRHFNWHLSIPTAVNFCEHHCLFAVFPVDAQEKGFTTKNLRSILRALTYDYLDVTLSEIDFLHYLPSKVGAVCLRAARVALKLSPTWPDVLRLSTGYCEQELFDCYRLLMRSIPLPDRKRKVEFGSPESGYSTDSDTAISPIAFKRLR